MICEIKQYLDDKTGGMIIAKIDVITEETINFTGMAQIPVKTPQGVQGVPVEFDIDADEIGDAFAQFEDSLKAKLEEMQTEHEKQQREQASAIVGVDGQPINKNEGGILPFPG